VVDLKFGNMKTKQFKSEFNKDIVVSIIGKDDALYILLKPIFETYGFGFMMPGKDIIFIDGSLGLNKHILKLVEAHEVAHFILGHSEAHNPKDEIDADRLAYEMLDGKGYYKAAQLVKDKFKERHGIEFK
jgi:hypothetical protein